jgi:hypothetical protein
VLYLQDGTPEAVPQYISGRTSYLQVRLAFHRYPQLIRAVFNRHRFGLPAGAYPAFNLAMGRSPGFGSTLTDYPLRETPCSDSVSLRLRPYGDLTFACQRDSPVHSAKGTPSPEDEPIGLRLLGSDGFQVLFHSPPGVLFTFPSRYWCAIGGQEYLALEGGPPEFPQGFSCPGVLGWLPQASPTSLTGLSPSLVALSNAVQVSDWFLTWWRGCRRTRQLPRPPLRNAGRLDTE